jgi:DNA-binding NarL/FixJ family response regulator
MPKKLFSIRNAKSARRRALPVVVLTGRTDTDTYKVAARRGIQGYLMKPISAGLLIETVKKVLGLAPAAEKAATESNPNPQETMPKPAI